jgi:hypothetical protein
LCLEVSPHQDLTCDLFCSHSPPFPCLAMSSLLGFQVPLQRTSFLRLGNPGIHTERTAQMPGCPFTLSSLCDWPGGWAWISVLTFFPCALQIPYFLLPGLPTRPVQRSLGMQLSLWPSQPVLQEGSLTCFWVDFTCTRVWNFCLVTDAVYMNHCQTV